MHDPIVFLPGLQSDHRSWVHQLTHFERTGPVMVPSGYLGGESLADMASMIEPQLPERFHLVAWSMGGYLAFQMLPRVVHRLASLILIATSAREDTAESTRNRHRRIAIAEARGMRVANRDSLSASCFDQSLLDTEPFKVVNDAAVEIGLDAYKRQQAAIIARPNSLDQLRLVRCRTLVIVGEADQTTPPQEAQIIHSAIPGSKLHLVPDCGHCVPMEKPKLVNDLIGNWIADAADRPAVE